MATISNNVFFLNRYLVISIRQLYRGCLSEIGRVGRRMSLQVASEQMFACTGVEGHRRTEIDGHLHYYTVYSVCKVKVTKLKSCYKY